MSLVTWNKEAKKRHKETKERLRQRDQAGQVPLLKFPENLADKIGGSGPVDEPEVKSRDELRKLLRVVWRRARPPGASPRAVSIAGMSERITNAGHQCEH